MTVAQPIPDNVSPDQCDICPECGESGLYRIGGVKHTQADGTVIDLPASYHCKFCPYVEIDTPPAPQPTTPVEPGQIERMLTMAKALHIRNDRSGEGALIVQTCNLYTGRPGMTWTEFSFRIQGKMNPRRYDEIIAVVKRMGI
jgi:hypothetical protein